MFLCIPTVSCSDSRSCICGLSLPVDIGDQQRLVGEEMVQGMNLSEVVHRMGL